MSVPFLNLFKTNCLSFPQGLASSYKEQYYLYKELNERSTQLACYLKRQGINKAKLVAILSKNYLERMICIIKELFAVGELAKGTFLAITDMERVAQQTIKKQCLLVKTR
ncbi:MAG: hypothetical protein REH83_06180 [Rickettsiella sp.]|nr:hypothetical protein [Rickettsiella sp.]